MRDLTLLNLEAPKMSAASDGETLPSMTDIEAWEGLLVGLRSNTGQVVTPEKARRCAAVLACMRGISEDLSSLPKRLMKRTPNGDEEVTDHEVFAALNVAPNELMTPMDLEEHIILELMLWGNFYVQKNEDPSTPGALNADNPLWPLEAAYVTRRYREAVWDFTDPVTGRVGSFQPGDIWRGSLLSVNGIDGYALTLLAREAIGLLLAAEEQGARLFSHGVQSDLKLETEETLEDTQKDQLRAAFMRRHAGSANAWMPLLLEGGLKASRLGLTAQESQYIESRKFQIEEVARVWRYPEVLLGISSGKSSTFASAEQFFQSYVKHTLKPWAVRIEQTANRDLLTGKERIKYYIKHDFDELLRGDTGTRYKNWNTGIISGFIQPAEARKREGFPYVEGLDYFVRPAGVSETNGGDPNAPQNTGKNNNDGTENVDGLAARVADHLICKEHRALIGKKQDADIFYTHFGGYVEDLTGADPERVRAYLEMRRTAGDRWSTESKGAAISALISLCKKDK